MQNTTNVALSRLTAQQRAMDVTAGNIANANTPGYRAERLAFFDIALTGEGYFQVETPRGPRLTRAGHFELSATGNVVNSDGHALLDAAGQKLQIATTDTHVTISADGTISSENGRIGRIGVVQPEDPYRIKPEGGRLFVVDGQVQAVAKPRMIQGAIEQSNVSPVVELTRMMRELREFEFTSKMVQAEAERQQTAIDKLTQKRS